MQQKQTCSQLLSQVLCRFYPAMAQAAPARTPVPQSSAAQPALNKMHVNIRSHDGRGHRGPSTMATATRTVEEQEPAATRPDGKFCLALQWNLIYGSTQWFCSEYLPRPDFIAVYSPESAITMIWACGISFLTAEQWATNQGLRGVIELPDGKVCMWSGGVPTLEYPSEDWLELAQRTLEETRFGPATNPETVCGELPPLGELVNRAEITFSDRVLLACLH